MPVCIPCMFAASRTGRMRPRVCAMRSNCCHSKLAPPPLSMEVAVPAAYVMNERICI